MAYKLKLNTKVGHIPVKKGFKKPFFHMGGFFPRFSQSIKLLSKAEKIIALVLLVSAFSLMAVYAGRVYISITKSVPAKGGSYTEGLLGEIKYINPVLASTDNDKSISALIYTGLVKFDQNNQILPDIAEKWEISADQKTYTFHLKNNVVFHDGAKLTSSDIAYTIDRIKELSDKSPLYDAWKDVQVTADDPAIVVFTLPKPYGPFLYNCNFGILPSAIAPEELSKKPIGTGKYKFEGIKINKETIKSVKLERNPDYYADSAFINEVEFKVFSGENDLKTAITNKKIDAAAIDETAADFKKVTYNSSKKMALILNAKDAKLSNKDLRKNILSDQPLPEKTSLVLDTIDSEPQKSKSQELKADFAKRNIELDVRLHKPVEMMDVLNGKKYQLLLYGFDFGHDRDPYLFWHSTQIGKTNMANWSTKETDLALEDARMIADPVQRNAKYDDFFKTVEGESVIKFYDIAPSVLTVSDKIKGVDANFGNESSSHFLNFEKWYIKEARVKK